MKQFQHFTRHGNPSGVEYRNLANTMRLHIDAMGIYFRGSWSNANADEVGETPALLEEAIADFSALKAQHDDASLVASTAASADKKPRKT